LKANYISNRYFVKPINKIIHYMLQLNIKLVYLTDLKIKSTLKLLVILIIYVFVQELLIQ
jgi:hypothetical protein